MTYKFFKNIYWFSRKPLLKHVCIYRSAILILNIKFYLKQIVKSLDEFILLDTSSEAASV